MVSRTGFIIICLCLVSAASYAAGLTTGFSEVTLEGLGPGKGYSTQEVVGLPLTVVNTGEEPVDLKMELLMPDMSELKEGFEPIPDLAWIRLEKQEFKEIQPNEAATTDVVISIPPDEQYQGKKFQVFIWTHTIGEKIGVGLKSKLLFTIAREQTAK